MIHQEELLFAINKSNQHFPSFHILLVLQTRPHRLQGLPLFSTHYLRQWQDRCIGKYILHHMEDQYIKSTELFGIVFECSLKSPCKSSILLSDDELNFEFFSAAIISYFLICRCIPL